jgi:hypothetical protein
VILCRDINIDDDWIIRRYNPNASNSFDDSGHLMNDDIIIGLLHIRTNKQLYSHTILILGNGSQEVSCHGDGSETNNKVT